MEIQYVKFFNNKIAVSYWDEKYEIWKEENITKLKINFLSILRTTVLFDSKLTIYGFMNQLEPYKDIIDSTFESASSGYLLNSYLKNMRETDLDDICLDLSLIEFYRAVEIWDNDITDYCSYHGKSKKDKLNYSLSFSSIKNWKHLPFILNTEYSIYNYSDKKPIISYNKDFTLYELLDGFIYELTFFGTPNEQREKGEEILEIYSKVKSGDIKVYSPDDLYLDSLEEDLEKEICDENYEKAEKIKKEIEELKLKLKKDGN